MPDIRLIASDMDGTLLSADLTVSPRNAEAIRAAQEKGVIFAVCSGRFAQFGAMKMREAGISCPVIAANGACIWDDAEKKIIKTFPIPAKTALKVNALLREYGVYYCIFAPDLITASQEGTTHLKSFWKHPVLTETYGLGFSNKAADIERTAAEGKALKFYVGRLPDNVYERLDADLKKSMEFM